MNYQEIKERVAEYDTLVNTYAKSVVAVSFTDLGLAVYELNKIMSALHGAKWDDMKEYYTTKNKIQSLIDLVKDLRRDLTQKNEKIKRAMIEISNERFEGELWREVLERAKDIVI